MRLAAAAGLAVVLIVVLVSAAIRLNASGIGEMFSASGLGMLRALHRTAASLEVGVVLWLAWSAWRRAVPSWKATGVVLALTVFLAVLGIIAGRSPTPLQAMGNLLAGLALAAAFAWLLNENRKKWGLTPFFLLLALQVVIGARLTIFGRAELPTLPLHALLGLGVAGLFAWLALARVGGGMGRLLFALALAAPVAGFTALHYEYSAAAALVHAASGAFLLVAAVSALGRNAESPTIRMPS